MNLKRLCIIVLFSTISMFANEFVDYSSLAKKYKAELKKSGNYATTKEVKTALQSKDWIVADVRTMEEWSAAHIKGSFRIGRQAPEKGLSLFVLDDDENFVRQNLIIVCNSASRASIEAQTLKNMGFKTVKVYDLYSWIDECNPVVTKYTVKKDKGGTGLKFGNFYAEHCKK